MIRILQMGMTDNLGGIETYLINYYRNIDKSKIQFDFTNIYPNDLCFQGEIIKFGGKVYKVSNYYKHPIKYIREVIKIIKENNYQIVHCNMNSAAILYPLIAAKLAGAKVIIAHSHNESSDKGIIKKLLHNLNKHFIPLFANSFFACSIDAGKWFFSEKILNSDNFSIIKNAIDIDKFKYNEKLRDKYRKELNISKDTVVIGHVGRFQIQKNHDKLVDIFYEYQKLNNNSKLLLIGSGPLESVIKDKVHKLDIVDKVIFLGNRHDVESIMQAMDLFVLPSLYEGLGIVLIEAQSSGLPVLTTTDIPNEAHLNNNYFTLNLSENSKKWADTIVNKIEIFNNRYDSNVESYNIKICSKELENKYINFSKIRICHFINGLVNGGVEKVIINYFSNMDNVNDYDLHVVTQGESDSKCLNEFQRLNFTIHTVTKKSVSLIKNYKDIKKILKKNKFDIVHCHMTTTNFLPLLYSKLSGVKVRISHSHLTNGNRKIGLAEKIYIFLTKIESKFKFACSKEAAKYLFGNKKDTEIINNAIDLEKYVFNETLRKEKRQELNIENKTVIGHIGRFVEQKNHNFIIDVFDKLYKENNNFHLILVGIGELENEIKEKVNNLGLNNAVSFLETRDDINELLNAFDVFILPSLYEGLGIVLIEAQANGLKCIASSNTPKEVEVTDNIKLLDLKVEQWVNEIKKIKKDYKRDNNIKQISNKGFDIKNEANRLDSIYKELMK